MSKSAGVKTDSTRGEQNIDPQTAAWIKQIMDAAQKAGAAGPSPLVGGATDYNSGLMKAGNLGLGAMSGDPNAVATLMNPYQQQVIDANNKQWGQTNQATQNQVNARATAAGAFGGSRQGVATGSALAQNNMAQQGQTAGLLQGGFTDAMNRAGQLAQGGFYGAGANANLGMGGVGNPSQWLMMMLNQGYKGPMGQSYTGHDTGFNTQASFHIPGQ